MFQSKNIKGQSTISSYFTKKTSPDACKTVNGQISSGTNSKPLPSTSVHTVNDDGALPCVKRPPEVIDVSSPVQLSKKAKIEEASSESDTPDLIPATPEEKPKKPVRSSKLKSRRRIGPLHLPTPQRDQRETDCHKRVSDTVIEKLNPAECKAELKRKSVSVSHEIRSENNLSTKAKAYSTTDDPLLAEILGDMVVVVSNHPGNTKSKLKPPKCLSEKQPNESQERAVQGIASAPFEQKPKPTSPKKKENGKLTNGLACTSKQTKQSNITSDVLKENAVSKSSPNKAQSCTVARNSSEEKPRNIFLGDTDGELISSPGRQFFVRRTSHKKKSLNPSGSISDCQAVSKSLPDSVRTVEPLAKLLCSEALKCAQMAAEDSSVLTVLKKKIIKKKSPQLSLNKVCVTKTDTKRVLLVDDEERALCNKKIGNQDDETLCSPHPPENRGRSCAEESKLHTLQKDQTSSGTQEKKSVQNAPVIDSEGPEEKNSKSNPSKDQVSFLLPSVPVKKVVSLIILLFFFLLGKLDHCGAILSCFFLYVTESK